MRILSLVLIACAAVMVTARVAPAIAVQPPNVVLLISDDQGWDDYSFMGHKDIKTPHIDRLAEQSLVYERGYVPTSLCRPSLATMITGLYPHQHGIIGNDPTENKRTNAGRGVMVDRFQQNPRLPELLKPAGYLSFQSGKWWEGHFTSGGFTHGMTHGDVERGGRHGDVGLQIGRKTMLPVFDFLDRVVEEKRPFLLWYAPMMPHLPHNPPGELLAENQADGRAETVARFFAMCQWWDRTCGQLLDRLDEKGLSDNTLVIYICDNGWTQRADQGGGAVGGTRGKRSAYDGGVRTPIMIRWPGRVEPRRDTLNLASSIDLVPTVLSAASTDRPKRLPGVDLLDAAAVAERDAIFGEIYTHDVPDLDRPTASLLYRWVIHRHWKLIEPTALATGEFGPKSAALFDLANDPEERHNLDGKYPERVGELRGRLQGQWHGP